MDRLNKEYIEILNGNAIGIDELERFREEVVYIPYEKIQAITYFMINSPRYSFTPPKRDCWEFYL